MQHTHKPTAVIVSPIATCTLGFNYFVCGAKRQVWTRVVISYSSICLYAIDDTIGLFFSYGFYFHNLTCVQKLNSNESFCTMLYCMLAHCTMRNLNPNINLKYEILSCLKFPSLRYHIMIMFFKLAIEIRSLSMCAWLYDNVTCNPRLPSCSNLWNITQWCLKSTLTHMPIWV